jgi:hypothetical protein
MTAIETKQPSTDAGNAPVTETPAEKDLQAKLDAMKNPPDDSAAPKAEAKPKDAVKDDATPVEPDSLNPKLSVRQIDSAKYLGYRDAEIAAMTPEQARQFEREAARERKRDSRDGNLQTAVKSLAQTVKALTQVRDAKTGKFAPEPGDGNDAGQPEGIRDTVLESLTQDDMGDYEKIVAKHGKLVDYTRKLGETTQQLKDRLAALETKETAIKEQQEAQETEAAIGKFDAFKRTLPRGDFDSLGDGPVASLDPDGPEAEKCALVMEASDRIKELRKLAGQQCTDDDAYWEALRIVSPHEHQAAGGRPENRSRPRTGGAAIPGSTPANARTEAPETKGDRALDEKLREQGILK